jgi:hypothetical protein
VLAARSAPSLAVKLAVDVDAQIVAFRVALGRLAPWSGGAAARSRLDHHQRRLLLRRNLRWRQTSLLQERHLVEQGFL